MYLLPKKTAFHKLLITGVFILIALLMISFVSSGNAVGKAQIQMDPLKESFIDPPQQARPRVWWHWMNGNVTKEGIQKDLEWMKRAGLGGFQNFDANLATPQVVEERLVFMTPSWRDAFRYAAEKAAELELEMAIASSPGWSQTGGPWVQPKDGMKKLAWSEILVKGGEPFQGTLPKPPVSTGPFQSIALDKGALSAITGSEADIPEYYEDAAVFAYPVVGARLPKPKTVTVNGQQVDGEALLDEDLETMLDVSRERESAPGTVLLDYGKAVTIQAARVLAKSAVDLSLSASHDGKQWQHLATITPKRIPYTISFEPITTRYVKLQFTDSGTGGFKLWNQPAPGADLSFLKLINAASHGPVIDKLADFRLYAEPKVNHFELKAGFGVAKEYYQLETKESRGVPLNVAAPNQVVDLTAYVGTDGNLNWTPEEGWWRIVRLGYSLKGTTNHPASAEATGLEVDKLDAVAVRNYMETYLGMYRETVGDELIGSQGLQAILTDSTEVQGFNWTPSLPEHFLRLRGYDITPWLPTLTGAVIGSREQTDAFLYDFRRTLAELHASEHYGTIAQVAHENGLRVYGESLEGGRPSFGNDMDMRSYADVPMAALWSYSREDGPKKYYVADIRGAASVAHIHGQNLVAAESLTSALQPWSLAPIDLKRAIDLAFVSGVNLPVIHTSVHQPLDDKQPGLSLAIFGQHFNRHETWAEMARPWVDYMARNSYLLQQGRYYADVAYFYGEEAPLTDKFGDEPTHYGYDYINAKAVLDVLTVEKGELVTEGGARYKVLYLGGSSQRMTVPLLKRIKQLVEKGATIVGQAPFKSPSQSDTEEEFSSLVHTLWGGERETRLGQGRVIADNRIEFVLANMGLKPDFFYSAEGAGEADSETDIRFLHRRLVDGEVYFINNRKNRAENVQAQFRVKGKRPELWNPENGSFTPLSYRIENDITHISLTLKPEDAFFVVFREPAISLTEVVKQTEVQAVGELTGPWSVRFQSGRGAPERITLPALDSLSEHENSAVKYFSGVATYEKAFNLPAGHTLGESLIIDLGKIGDIAEVWVNGKKSGTAWLPPYQVDIGGQVDTGENRVEIRVANLWVNRLIGDAGLKDNKITYTALPTFRADAPLRSSGLIGPVKLLTKGGH